MGFMVLAEGLSGVDGVLGWRAVGVCAARWGESGDQQRSSPAQVGLTGVGGVLWGCAVSRSFQGVAHLAWRFVG